MDRALRARGGDRATARVGRLRGELQHYAYRDIADHLETIDRYTTLAARQMHESGRRAGAAAARRPSAARVPAQLPRCSGGFRDGVAGLHHLGDERVLRVPEVREALGARVTVQARASRPEPGTREP